jgi:hypothetical protein
LSFRDVEDLLAERGITVSYETVRRWVNHFGPMIAADLRKRRAKPYGSVRNLVRRAGWEPLSTLMQVLDAKIATRSAI